MTRGTVPLALRALLLRNEYRNDAPVATYAQGELEAMFAGKVVSTRLTTDEEDFEAGTSLREKIQNELEDVERFRAHAAEMEPGPIRADALRRAEDADRRAAAFIVRRRVTGRSSRPRRAARPRRPGQHRRRVTRSSAASGDSGDGEPAPPAPSPPASGEVLHEHVVRHAEEKHQGELLVVERFGPFGLGSYCAVCGAALLVKLGDHPDDGFVPIEPADSVEWS